MKDYTITTKMEIMKLLSKNSGEFEVASEHYPKDQKSLHRIHELVDANKQEVYNVMLIDSTGVLDDT